MTVLDNGWQSPEWWFFRPANVHLRVAVVDARLEPSAVPGDDSCHGRPRKEGAEGLVERDMQVLPLDARMRLEWRRRRRQWSWRR